MLCYPVSGLFLNLYLHDPSLNVGKLCSSKRSNINPITAPFEPDIYEASWLGYEVPYDSKYSQSPYSYRDKKGFSWFLRFGSKNQGIHPDENVSRTKGCIGIVDTKTSI
ncbi:MAG: hypothetical protein D6B27_12695 [Gammaproteobacteria bacterium]|nr:MAG: hypothetical protein D6B27_12695 [Gammaproteobacteria bacterium]